MNADAYNDLRRIVREELKSLSLPTLAIVQDIHPHESGSDTDNYGCTVRLRDTDAVLERVPVMTGRKGAASIPDIGDLVLLQFLNGQANAPVIIGTFYNDEDRPPENAEGEARLRLPFDAGEGDGVDLRVASKDASSLTLNMGNSLKLTLQDDDPVVAIDVGSGSASLTIDSDGTLTLNSQKAIVLDSANEVSLKGAAVTIESQGELKLKGAVINLN